MDALSKYLSKFDTRQSTTSDFIFRGQANADWRVLSAAERQLASLAATVDVKDVDALVKHQQGLLERARSQGFGRTDGNILPDLHLLAQLQHFGAPTGLIDFTRSFLVALWFAANECQDKDGKVFLLDISKMAFVEKIFSTQEQLRVKELFATVDSTKPHLTYWVPPPSLGDDALRRILPQSSVFLIRRGLLGSAHPKGVALAELIIEKKDKPDLLHQLRALNIEERTLFLDLHGFAQTESRRSAPLLDTKELVRLGNSSFEAREHELAVSFYDRAVSQSPDVAEVYFIRANAKAAMGRHGEAIDDLEIAGRKADDGQVLVEPHPPISPLRELMQGMILFNRANSRMAIGDYAGAIADYRKSEEISPFPTESLYMNLGNALFEAQDFGEAVGAFDRAIEKGNTRAYYHKGLALLLKGDLATAKSTFREATRYEGEKALAGAAINTIETIETSVGNEFQTSVGRQPSNGQLLLEFIVGIDQTKDTPVSSAALAGRTGNTGNFGWQGVGAGEGYDGGEPIRIQVRK